MKTIAGVKVLTVQEVAKQLAVTAKTVIRMIGDQRIGAKKIGKSWFVTEASLREFIESPDNLDDDDDESADDDERIVGYVGNADPDDGYQYQVGGNGTIYAVHMDTLRSHHAGFHVAVETQEGCDYSIQWFDEDDDNPALSEGPGWYVVATGDLAAADTDDDEEEEEEEEEEDDVEDNDESESEHAA